MDPVVHAFPAGTTTGHVYDYSQTQDVKDGDILTIDGAQVAIMVKAWPVWVGGGDTEGEFHTLKDGDTWGSFENGRYLRSYDTAREHPLCDLPANNQPVPTFKQLRTLLVQAGLIESTCREVGPYCYTQNGGTKKARGAGYVAQCIRRIAVSAGLASGNHYPGASWASKYPQTNLAREAEAAGVANFELMLQAVVNADLLPKPTNSKPDLPAETAEPTPEPAVYDSANEPEFQAYTDLETLEDPYTEWEFEADGKPAEAAESPVFKSVDYGMGMANVDQETGIRFGVIPQRRLADWTYSSFELIYPERDHGAEEDEEADSFFEEMEADMQVIEDKDYHIHGNVGSYATSDDLFIERSPYFTYCGLCSPCAPGAGYLLDQEENEETGYKAFCPGPEFFEEGENPLAIYLVSTGEQVRAQEVDRDGRALFVPTAEPLAMPNNRARWSGDWHIVTGEGQSIESYCSKHIADLFCGSCNEHEAKNGREPNYTVKHTKDVTAYYPDYSEGAK